MDLKRLHHLAIALLTMAALGPAADAQTRLDTTQFIVVGEGLAAGMADFALRDVYQKKSFPALMATQMGTAFPMPLFESPGLAGEIPGYATIPARVPGTLQGSVRTEFPPDLFVFNLSVPGMRLADSLSRRPLSPIIQSNNPQQTMLNMILGYPALIAGRNLPLWTQAEYAVKMNPTLILVELGYFEVLEAAAKDDPRLLPDVAAFRANYNTLLSRLRLPTQPAIVVMTIPDPFDTAFFTTVPNATKFVGTPPDELQKIFKLKPDDLITPNGMILVGGLILTDGVDPLLNPLFPGLQSFFPGTVVSATTRTAVRSRVQALNAQIQEAAREANAAVYDLNALFARIRNQGIRVGTKTYTADFLGGFYSMNGYYPGLLGHGLIANEVLTLLNGRHQTSFSMVDLNAIAADDPVVRFTPARRPAPQEEQQ
jgi:hypothetical protein